MKTMPRVDCTSTFLGGILHYSFWKVITRSQSFVEATAGEARRRTCGGEGEGEGERLMLAVRGGG